MIFDFFKGAFPWIFLGLAIAIIVVAGNAAKMNGKKGNKAIAWYVVSAINYAVALMMLADEGHINSDFTTWASLGSLFLCLGTFECLRARKAEKNNGQEEQK